MQELKLVPVDDPPNEQCPTRRSHPFWKSVIGSTLTLEMITPPESQLKYMSVRVYSMSLPTIYQLSAVYSGGKRDTMYCHDWEARAIIKNEWLKHYRARTRIIYSPHTAVDMSKMVMESSPQSTDSSSPRSMDNSLDSSPRHWLSPRGGDSQPGSNNSSPGSSPRSRDWFKKRLSLPPLAATAGDDSALTSPKTSPSSSTSTNSSPRRWFLKRSPSGGGISPRPKTPSPRSPKLNRSANSPMFRELLDKTRERYSNKQ